MISGVLQCSYVAEQSLSFLSFSPPSDEFESDYVGPRERAQSSLLFTLDISAFGAVSSEVCGEFRSSALSLSEFVFQVHIFVSLCMYVYRIRFDCTCCMVRWKRLTSRSTCKFLISVFVTFPNLSAMPLYHVTVFWLICTQESAISLYKIRLCACHLSCYQNQVIRAVLP